LTSEFQMSYSGPTKPARKVNIFDIVCDHSYEFTCLIRN
jgi:hypothetical protein